MADEVRMAMRDASFYNRPDTAAPKVYHVVVSPPYVAACDANVMLDADGEVSVPAASPGMRCQRPGCRNRWKAAEEAT